MTFHRGLKSERWWMGLGLAVAVAGCCATAEKKAERLQGEVKTLTAEVATLKSSNAVLQPMEGELTSCKTDLEGAKTELNRLGQQETLMEQRQETIKGLLDKLKGIIAAGKLSVRVRRGRLVLELPSAVLFESGKAELSDKGKETLDSVAAVLKDIKGRNFQVAGHTDSEKMSEESAYETNWHLSTARAVAVVIYLRSKGVRPKRLSAAGYAANQPVASNKTKKGKARNRRIEITLMPNLNELPDLSSLEKKLGLSDPEEAPVESDSDNESN